MYVRVSTADQVAHNLSLPDQKNQIRAYAEKHGLTLVSEFEELGVSGTDDHRPVFQDMIARGLSKPPEFTIVLVHSLSRFFRDDVLSEYYRAKLERNGVQIISITQDFGTGPMADMTRKIMGIVDTMNSAETAKHVHRAQLENARQGFWNGSKAPIGYKSVVAELRGDKEKKRLEIDAQGAEVVRLIFRLCLDGDGSNGPLGIKSIMLYLNAHGYTTAAGKRFQMSYVEKVLKHEIYVGRGWYNKRDVKRDVLRPKEEWIAFTVPAIISEEDFQRVQTGLLLRSPKVTAPRLVNSPVLLTGLAKCGSCGSVMIRRTGKGGKYSYYRCSEFARTGTCEGGAAAAMNTLLLDEIVLSRVSAQLLTPERVKAIVAEIAARRESGVDQAAAALQQLRDQYSKARKKLSRLMHALGEGTIESTETFKATVKESETNATHIGNLIEVQERLVGARMKAVTLEEAAKFATGFKAKLTSCSPAMKKRIIRSFVKSVVVSEDEITIIGSKSDLAEIVTGGTQ
jgi:site-specific DNA recombinase